MRKSAEEKARIMVEEQEIVKTAKEKSAEMIAAAENKSRELRRIAAAYVDDLMRQTEESISSALATVQNSRGAFRSAGASAAKSKSEEVPVQE